LSCAATSAAKSTCSTSMPSPTSKRNEGGDGGARRHQLAHGGVRVLDEGLLDEAVLGEELLDAAADHLLDDLRRLAGLQRLGRVDFLSLATTSSGMSSGSRPAG
jgi:hypothetical protein